MQKFFFGLTVEFICRQLQSVLGVAASLPEEVQSHVCRHLKQAKNLHYFTLGLNGLYCIVLYCISLATLA